MSSERFGPWLRQQRRARRVTQTELEDRAELGDKYVSKLENGDTTPGDEVRARIHKVLGTSDDDLVDVGILEKVQAPGYDPVYIARRGVEDVVRIEVIDPKTRQATAIYDVGGDDRAAIAQMLERMPDREVQKLRMVLEVFEDYFLRPDEPQ